MNRLAQLWQIITNNGVNDAGKGKTVVKIKLLNQLIFIGFSTSLLALTSYVITGEDFIMIALTLDNILLQVIGFYFAYQQKHHITRFLICWFFPSLIAIHVIVLGGNFGETNIFTALALLNFIIYEDKKLLKILSVAYASILFIASKLYVITYSSQFVIEKTPYDEIVTFPMIVIILGLIVLLYQNSLKKYEQEQAILIDNLEQKNQKLLAVNKELEEFTYIASHDLKNPLRSISNHLDLIRINLKRDNRKGIEESVTLAKGGTQQIHALVRDVLEYKEITSSDAANEIIDLNEIIVSVLNNYNDEEIIQKSEIYCQELTKIKGREIDFIVLFQNIIENGIKYNTSEKPTVWIKSESTKESLILTFKDNGIGIESKFHTKVFQFFKRLHTQEKYKGTGIGLGLCKKIIQNYNGNILLKSKKNEGSIFKIIIPSKYQYTEPENII